MSVTFKSKLFTQIHLGEKGKPLNKFYWLQKNSHTMRSNMFKSLSLILTEITNINFRFVICRT